MIKQFTSIHGEVRKRAKYAHWYDWERTFLYFPKTDINGKLIIGKVWKKERYGSVAGEYNPKTGLTPLYQCTDISYANSKDVFMDKLKDKTQ